MILRMGRIARMASAVVLGSSSGTRNTGASWWRTGTGCGEASRG